MGTRRDAIKDWHESHHKRVTEAEKADKGVADEIRKNPLLTDKRAREIVRGKEA